VSRLACWLLCVVIITITWALEGFPATDRYLTLVGLMGMPGFMHWMFQQVKA